MDPADSPMDDAKLRAIIEHLTAPRGDLFAVQDSSFRYTDFNQAYAREFERLWGVKLEVGTDMREALASWPEQQQNAVELWARAHAGEKFEIDMAFGPDGDHERIYRLYFQPMEGCTGHASHILRDVTQERIMEQALAESETRFRALADNIAQLAWMAKPDGSIFWFNRRWEEFTGIGVKETSGMAWTQAHHPEHAERVSKEFKRALQNETPWEDTFPLRGADGVYRWFLSRALPIRDADGQISAWFGTNTDITEQRRVEEDLRTAHRRKDEYLATLGHELRNPLASIQTASEIIHESSPTAPNVRKASEVLLRQVSQAVSLVDGLLEVSRLAVGKIEVECGSHDLRRLCKEVLEDRHSLFAERGLSLTWRLPDAQLWANLDPVRAVQVLDNVLTNALKFTPAPGEVTLTLGEADAQPVVEVSDTGVGLSHSSLAEIFDPLHQDISHLHLSSGGLGLGLALCRTLMELQGGTIEARSPGRGEGATFSIRFAAAEPVTQSGTAQLSAAPTNLRVLIVEDNADSAEMLHAMLSLKGLNVSIAADAPSALEKLRHERFDAVLSDIGLPGMSGLELARQIRSEEKLRDLALIAISGYGQPSDRERSREAGFDDHLVKPVSAQTLLAALKKALESSASKYGTTR